MQKGRSIGVFPLAMINVAAICNIKNFPLTAEYGLASLFFFTLAALIYFIPVSLISAELATGWPERGVYQWVTVAMGKRMGFLAIWLQWIENIIWYPTVLSFIAATFAYIFNPSLATNQTYIFLVVIISFWMMTFVNFLGMKASGFVSTISALFGTILPGALIILLGFIWMAKGNPSHISFEAKNLFPDLSSINEIAILAGVLLSFAGMEMSAVHAKEVDNPKKNYPKAIFLSASIILILYTIGSLSIGIVVPKGEIELASGSIEAFRKFFDAFNISWAVPIVATIMTIGGLGMIGTWIVGPSKGVYASALDGELPPVFQKTNKRKMPTSLMIFQAVVVSILSTVFLFMPDVSSSYWILIDLTAQLYLIMYIQLFLAGIILRYKHPDVKRSYRVPLGNKGMWTVGIIGICGAVFTIIVGFFPPSNLAGSTLPVYESFLIGGIVLFCAIPLLIHYFKKESWKSLK
ncbi:MAG: amino acid permease [Chlamydiae bacterium CG10_big_fil_rev_8_21_14_0_10_35_9]|nr:MAG: amino acid permease [Chlamydiae bacterium CG10_big_fil_rev_8_21_14_0_10_35_9]